MHILFIYCFKFFWSKGSVWLHFSVCVTQEINVIWYNIFSSVQISFLSYDQACICFKIVGLKKGGLRREFCAHIAHITK
jgi:hypothetical protein